MQANGHATENAGYPWGNTTPDAKILLAAGVTQEFMTPRIIARETYPQIWDAWVAENGKPAVEVPAPPASNGKKKSALELELEKLRAENEKLKAEAKQPGTITLKVSEKGALSLYGLGRMPITHYAEHWLKFIAMAKQIVAFIEANHAKLNWKNGDPYAK